MPIRQDIFCVTVGLEEDEGICWTALSEFQNITFTETLSVCQRFLYWKVSIFIEETNSYKIIGISM